MKKTVLGGIMALSIAAAAVMASPMQAMAAKFDAGYYAQTYADVRNAFGTDQAALYNHYLTFGMKEGRLPYAGAVPGEAVEGQAQNPNQAASVKFDPYFYAQTYADVRNAFGTDQAALYNHYLTFGMKEGRLPYAGAVLGMNAAGAVLGTNAGETADVQAASSLAIDITVDKWENITPNKISTSIIGESATCDDANLAVPFRITMKVPAMQKKNNVTLACRAVVTDILPAGMEYNEDSLHVYVNNTRVPSTAYSISVTGQILQVTLNGINQYPYSAKEGDELVISYFVTMNDGIGYENKNMASVQYDYGTFSRKRAGEPEEKYIVYVCQFCGFRAKSQSEVSAHQRNFISANRDSMEHSLARGLCFDYMDSFYEESEFIVEEGYTLQSGADTATLYLVTE